MIELMKGTAIMLPSYFESSNDRKETVKTISLSPEVRSDRWHLSTDFQFILQNQQAHAMVFSGR